MTKIKRPTDINQRAKSIVDIATDEVTENITPQNSLKSAAALLNITCATSNESRFNKKIYEH